MLDMQVLTIMKRNYLTLMMLLNLIILGIFHIEKAVCYLSERKSSLGPRFIQLRKSG
jgi:hypothetical protein